MIDLTADPGGLFTRLGLIAYLVYIANQSQALLPDATDSLFDQFDGDDRHILTQAIAASVVLPATPVSGLGPFAALAQSILIMMVRDDNPAAGGTLESCLNELIRQMDEDNQTVQRCTVGYTATALTGNVGNGALVVTTTRGDGLPQENLIPEVARIACLSDSYTGTATEGAEQFGYFGGTDRNQTRLDYDWPRASGVQVSFPAVSPDRIASNGTLITNGDFETWTVANTPDEWEIVSGTAGTNIFKESTNFYKGTFALRFNGGATQWIRQTITLVPHVSYALAAWVKRSGVAAAGNLRFWISGTDEQGVNNFINADLTSATYNSFAAVTGIFRPAKNYPSSTLYLNVQMTSALSGGVNCFIDNLSITPVTVPYAGGPGIAIFPGSTPFAAGDGWSVDFTNDAGGSTYGATFQRFVDRVFGMKELGLVLPSSGSPTIPDSLIV